MEHESDGFTDCNRCSWYSHQRIIKRTGGHDRTSEDYPNYSIVKIGQNTEKSPGDLRRLAVSQTPVKDQPSGNTDMKNSHGWWWWWW